MYYIETNNIVHKFSNGEIALNNINLKVVKGSIYGFLGPNGAGKTTTLKLILGLLKKQQGEILLFGKPLETDRITILKDVGSLIESPSVYGHLTATENLTLLQKIYQCPEARIQEVINLVGLTIAGNKKVHQFSLGMKQRLSIAIALLHNPKLLILDEPTNGLDPNGMIEIRELLLKLNKEENITILISSHLLSEIEKLVSHIGIINKGKLIVQGTLEELEKKQKETLQIILETNDISKTITILTNNDVPFEVKDNKIVVPHLKKKLISKINKDLVEENIEVYEMSLVTNNLETIFMNLINN